MDSNLKNVISIEEIDQIETLDQLNITEKLNTKSSNFFKMSFEFNAKKFEIGISLYSNLIFIIITNNSKLGNIWLAEIEEENEQYLLEEEDNDLNFEIRCILGERNDELFRIISSMIVRKLASIYKKKGNQIKTVLVSLAFKSAEIENIENLNNLVKITDSTKKFIEIINNKIEEMF